MESALASQASVARHNALQFADAIYGAVHDAVLPIPKKTSSRVFPTLLIVSLSIKLLWRSEFAAVLCYDEWSLLFHWLNLRSSFYTLELYTVWLLYQGCSMKGPKCIVHKRLAGERTKL